VCVNNQANTAAQSLETVQVVAYGRYVEVSGNHMTMLFGEGAQRMLKAILNFMRS
jgi:hypothetical protein